MTTYDESGGYPHPDHIRCHEVSMAAYEAAGGRPVGDLDYYIGFGYWKLACILEGVFARYKAGAMGDDGADADAFGSAVNLLGRASLASLDKIGA